MRIHRLWLLAMAVTLALVVGPPANAQLPLPESALGTYPVPAVVGMTAKPRCIRSLEVRPRVMARQRRYDIEVRIAIEAHADHRLFALAFTSDAVVEGGTIRELNTRDELSPVTQEPIVLRRQAGGHYVFVLAVIGADGALVDRRTAEIKALDGGEVPWRAATHSGVQTSALLLLGGL